MAAQKYLKMWLGIPARGCTSLGVFSPYLLGVKRFSQVYLEGHLSAYISSKLVADDDTKEALRCAEEREGRWVNKSSTIIECRNLVSEMTNKEDYFVPTPENTNTYA